MIILLAVLAVIVILGAWLFLRVQRSVEFRAVRFVRARLEREGVEAPSEMIVALVGAANKVAEDSSSGNPEVYAANFGSNLATLIMTITFWAKGLSDDVSLVSPDAYPLFEKHLGKFNKSA